MPDVLISPDILRAHDREIRAVTDNAIGAADVAGVSADYFRYYLVFSERLASAVGLGEIDEPRSFYNAYYWFERFVRAHIAEHGPDAGLEQQAFQMLEHAPIELDPDVMAEITERIERDSRG